MCIHNQKIPLPTLEKFSFLFLQKLPKRNTYITERCGKNTVAERKALSSESASFQESQARLQKEFLFRTDSDFFSEQLRKMQKYFVYFKDSEGSYEEKDWLFRKESTSKVSQ